MAKRNKKKNPKFFTFIYLLLLIISSIFLYVIYSLNMLPLRYYLLIVCAFVIILSFFGLILLNKRIRKPLKVIFTLFAIILNIGMALVSNYTFNAQDVMNKITKKVNYKTENYSLVILSSGNYEEVADLESKDIGYLDNGTKGTKKALETLGGMVKLANDDYDDVQKLANDLLKEKINAILVEDSFKEILEEETEDFKDATEVLYSFSVKIPEENHLKKQMLQVAHLMFI